MTSLANPMSRQLESRIDAFGWGLFFLVSGVVLLAPGLPDGTWLLGVGAILVGLSAFRWMQALPVSGFAVALGLVATVSGVGAIAGVAIPGFSLLMILCGVALVLGQLVRRGSRM